MRTVSRIICALPLITINVTLAALAFAGVPQTMNYQGYIKNTDGTPVSIATTVRFSLYSSNPARNNPLWSETKSVTPVNGIYSVQLGSQTPITAPFDVPYHLGVKVEGDAEMALQPLSSVPYARRASVADSVPASAIANGTLTGSMLTDGTITSSKLAPGVVHTWQNITASTTAAANTGYVTSGTTPVILTLPTTPTVGDIFSITGAGTAGWLLKTSGTQTILSGTILPAGATVWTPRPNSGTRTWTSIASSADGSKLAAAAYVGQIYTSTDSGATWTARGGFNTWTGISSSADGINLAAVTQGDKIFTSNDSGVSWTERGFFGNWRAVTSSADGVKLATVITGNHIVTSNDSGNTWTFQPATSGGQWLSIASSADGSKLLAGSGGAAGELYTSSDSGVSWTAQASPIGKEWYAVASSADGTKLAAVIRGGQIYTSSDSGVTWFARESSRQWSAISSSADGTRLAATVSPGQIFTSADSGFTWTARDSSGQWSAIASSSDGTRLAAADQNDLIHTSTGGITDSIIGGPRDNIQLQYTSNNQYQVFSYLPETNILTANISPGSVTTATLSDGAVTDAKISGPISAAKIDLSAVVAGTVNASQFSGDGSGLTNVKATNVTGTIAIANGGTGATKSADALVALGAVSKSGDIMTGSLTLPTGGLSVGANELVVKSGKVGIGTLSPETKLQVSGGAIKFGDAGGWAANSIQFEPQSGFHRIAFNDLRFFDWSSGYDNITFKGGQVGIGTNIPTSKLTVAGTIETSSGGIKFPDGTVQSTAKSDCANGRYEDNGNGTVSDCRTGLIWLKNADCPGLLNWDNAVAWVGNLGSGICGLTDASSPRDWRLPTKTEWMAMVASARKQGYLNPSLTNREGTAKWMQGDLFDNVQASYYWSSSTVAGGPYEGWYVHLDGGNVGWHNKSIIKYVWPVRAGQ